MTAVNVQFEDCGDAFTVCRCNDATMSMDTVIQRPGSVPVGLRRYTRLVDVVVVLNGNGTDPHAYTLTNGDIHLFADCEMDAWVHEVWSYDARLRLRSRSAAIGYNGVESGAPGRHLCTRQLRTHKRHGGDFAQVGVVKAYMALHGGSLPPGLIADCMANQLAFMDKLALYDPVTLFGNTCAIKEDWPPARQTEPPAMLDTTRTFQVVPSENGTPTVDPGRKNAGTTARTIGAVKHSYH
ncbi:hypothetical protein C8R43DRAFT_1138729 [Mycena crocata]|nr:hypothetical protein C8R43DRAFT_1138729 [Mycena crocata]